ncbi:helix-turn-helix domain-containing protein [Nocardia sp. IFM 10818]
MPARRLLPRLDELTDDLIARILQGDHAYAEATLLGPELLRSSVRTNLAAMLGQLAGTTPARIDPAVAAGRMKAERGVPLPALLHAYRLAGRLLWQELAGEPHAHSPAALTGTATAIWQLIDEYSGIAADAYAEFLAERTRHDEQARRSLLCSVLDGAAPDQDLWDAVRALRLPTHGQFAVVAAELDSSGAAQPGRLENRLRAIGIHSAWLLGDDGCTGLLSLPTTAIRRNVGAVIAATGITAAGVSLLFPDPARAREAVRQARLALCCATPGTEPVVEYGDHPIRLLLANAPRAGHELSRAILGALLDLPEPERGELLGTLRAWFDSGGSIVRVAARLHFHRNTIHQRLRRVEALTGRSCADPRTAAELYVALLALPTQPRRPAFGHPDSETWDRTEPTASGGETPPPDRR